MGHGGVAVPGSGEGVAASPARPVCYPPAAPAALGSPFRPASVPCWAWCANGRRVERRRSPRAARVSRHGLQRV